MPRERPAPRAFEPAWLQRSLDRYYVWGLVFMAVLIVGFPVYRLREPSLREHALREQQVNYAREGTRLFEQNCAQCHGSQGIGDEAPTLNAKEFLDSTSDQQIHHLVAAGISGSEMPAWSIEFGGPFTDQQILEIVAYLRSLEKAAPSVPDWREGRPVAGATERVGPVAAG